MSGSSLSGGAHARRRRCVPRPAGRHALLVAAGRRAGHRPLPCAGVRVLPRQPWHRVRAPCRVSRSSPSRPARSPSPAPSPAPATWWSITPTACRATYGRLATVAVSRGQSVRAGDRLGTTTDGFYFGLRRGVAPDDAPVDPTPMLGVRRYPPRLVPVDGTPGRRAGPRPAGLSATGWSADSIVSTVRRLGGPVPIRRAATHIAPPTLRSPDASAPGARVGAQPTAERSTSWPSSPCDRCWKQVSTSGTRPVVGTRR